MTATNPPEYVRRQREAAIQQQIGANIRAARLARAVSQEELAAALAVERPTLSRYERGERSIPVTILLDIAALLDTSVERLIQAAPKAEQPAVSLDTAIGQQAALSHVIQRLSAQPDAIPLVHGLLDTLETEHPGDRS
jgi:transcriptional regulator with XRE-family HTH domain